MRINFVMMKTATIQELKQELQGVAQAKLLDLCLRLAKFKKDNKELLTYLLFESHDEEAYISSVKELMDEGFTELPKATVYLTKKSLRKTLRITNKYIRYSGSKQVEAVLLIYFCRLMKESGIPFRKKAPLENIYEGQLKKVRSALEKLHEDLQFDYLKQVEALEDPEKKKRFWKL